MIFIVYLDYLFSFNIFHFTSDGYYTKLRDCNGAQSAERWIYFLRCHLTPSSDVYEIMV